MTMTNAQRAERAQRAIEGGNYNEDGADLSAPGVAALLPHQAVKDLLCDLRHLCDRIGVDFALASASGYGEYDQERRNDEPGDWPLFLRQARHEDDPPADPWVCTECGQTNSSWATTCGRCQAPKAERGPGGEEPLSEHEQAMADAAARRQ